MSRAFVRRYPRYPAVVFMQSNVTVRMRPGFFNAKPSCRGQPSKVSERPSRHRAGIDKVLASTWAVPERRKWSSRHDGRMTRTGEQGGLGGGVEGGVGVEEGEWDEGGGGSGEG